MLQIEYKGEMVEVDSCVEFSDCYLCRQGNKYFKIPKNTFRGKDNKVNTI